MDAIQRAEANGYRVVPRPGAKTLRLAVSVNEIDPEAPATSRPSIEAELFDSRSGGRLALVLVRAERAKLGPTLGSWDERTVLLAAWARELRRALDLALR